MRHKQAERFWPGPGLGRDPCARLLRVRLRGSEQRNVKEYVALRYGPVWAGDRLVLSIEVEIRWELQVYGSSSTTSGSQTSSSPNSSASSARPCVACGSRVATDSPTVLARYAASSILPRSMSWYGVSPSGVV